LTRTLPQMEARDGLHMAADILDTRAFLYL
jgi:hypothetical protein